MVDVEGMSSGEEGDIEENQDDEETEDKKLGVAGMADVIGKILGKKVKDTDEGVILSKFKEGKKRKLERKEEALEKSENNKRKAEFREKNHVIPDRSNAEKEVALRRIGTKGVVKLFNAVTKHQKETDSKLKKASTIGKKDKVLESVSQTSFLDMLKSDDGVKADKKETKRQERADESISAETSTAPSWNILRDDFMMGSKMKDWDKEGTDNEDENEDHDDSEGGDSDESESS